MSFKIKNSDEIFCNALKDLADSVAGKSSTQQLKSKNEILGNAVNEILKFYGIKPKQIPNNMNSFEKQAEYLLKPNGIFYRKIKLEKGWFKNATGAMIGFEKSNNKMVAFIPRKFSGYYCINFETEKKFKITKKNEIFLKKDAILFNRELPLENLTTLNILKLIKKKASPSSLALLFLATLAAVLIGLIIPKLTKEIFSSIILIGNVKLVILIGIFLSCTIISKNLMELFKDLINHKIVTKLNLNVELSTVTKILNMPISFFKDFTAGELAAKTKLVEEFFKSVAENFLKTVLTSIFSLAYIIQIFSYTKLLTLPVVLTISSIFTFSIICAKIRASIGVKLMKLIAKESGTTFSIISGIEKIKLTGTEKMAFSMWAKTYAKQAKIAYNPPFFLKINKTILKLIVLAGSLSIHFIAAKINLKPENYCAFIAAYGLVLGSFLNFFETTLNFAKIKPLEKITSPIFKTPSENFKRNNISLNPSGRIKISNLSFCYEPNGPKILNNISLEIEPGQSVAIVGKTGCGKSTFLKLLIGFETPTSGAIYFDRTNLNELNLQHLRKKLGIVMQDMTLFEGDFQFNINLENENLTLIDAWRAAKIATLDEDVAKMPMKMKSLVSQCGKELSKSQKQKILIARAMVKNPKILILDEATSWVDEVTQQKIFENINRLKLTKIMVAHRLSTIKQCDRIIFLENGEIAEDGTFESLIAKKGLFHNLFSKQKLKNSE